MYIGNVLESKFKPLAHSKIGMIGFVVLQR